LGQGLSVLEALQSIRLDFLECPKITELGQDELYLTLNNLPCLRENIISFEDMEKDLFVEVP